MFLLINIKLGLVRLLGMSIGDGCGVRVFRLGRPGHHSLTTHKPLSKIQYNSLAYRQCSGTLYVCLKSVFVSHIGIYWITGVLLRTNTFHREICGREKHTRTNLMSQQCENIGWNIYALLSYVVAQNWPAPEDWMINDDSKTRKI